MGGAASSRSKLAPRRFYLGEGSRVQERSIQIAMVGVVAVDLNT